MITEPTRDEINRALAEWEGWTDFDIPPPGHWHSTVYAVPPGQSRVIEPIPDYCSSLDAQMPLWERARARHWSIRLDQRCCVTHRLSGHPEVMIVLESKRGLAVVKEGFPVPEASARALYAAILEASR